MSKIEKATVGMTEDDMSRVEIVVLTEREQHLLEGGVGERPLKPPPNEGGNGPDGDGDWRSGTCPG